MKRAGWRFVPGSARSRRGVCVGEDDATSHLEKERADVSACPDEKEVATRRDTHNLPRGGSLIVPKMSFAARKERGPGMKTELFRQGGGTAILYIQEEKGVNG